MLLTKETQRNLFLIPLEVMSFRHKVDEVLEILTLKHKPLEIIRDTKWPGGWKESRRLCVYFEKEKKQEIKKRKCHRRESWYEEDRESIFYVAKQKPSWSLDFVMRINHHFISFVEALQVGDLVCIVHFPVKWHLSIKLFNAINISLYLKRASL